MKITVPRGTCDVLPVDSYKWSYIEEKAREIANRFNFREIRTPVFEHTELFIRGIGNSTDIVRKEMYTFDDKKGRSMTLRPEGTATVMRSVLENNLYLTIPTKLFYIGPFFRYERPQEGRYRQFHQFGLEAIGIDSPEIDAEIIHSACTFFEALGLKEIKVQLNSLGCSECRPKYREALISFFENHREELCSDCKERLSVNPLRVIDCKNPNCKQIALNAPVMMDFLCDDCKKHFEKLQKFLSIYSVDFNVNPRIVRGLDYYTRTVFEIVSNQLGAQDAICGGGRYNGLAEEIGGKNLPAVGFAAGIERTIALMTKCGCSFGKEPSPRVIVIPLDNSCDEYAASVLAKLRNAKISADMVYVKRNLKKILKDVSTSETEYAYIIGSDEMSANKISVKLLKEKNQIDISIDNVVNFVSGRGNC